ncbi:MAG: M12 family metallo-peptidase [Balneola sp.]
MKAITKYILIILGMFMPVLCIGQPGIFEQFEKSALNLTETQDELVLQTTLLKQVSDVFIVKANNLSMLKDKETFLFNVPDSEEIQIYRTKKQTLNDGRTRWVGNLDENKIGSTAEFIISDSEFTGMVRSANVNFDIQPLKGTEFHLLIKIDPSKFDKELSPMMPEDIEDGNNAVPKNKSMVTPTIKILVAYTNAAETNYSGNMNSLITLAEGNLGDSFITSNVNANVDVVHKVKVNYSESGTSALDLCRLTTSQSFTPTQGSCSNYTSGQLQGHMENIHELRYQYDANLVVLITGSGGAGIGWQPASTSYAFSIARYDVAASNYTFSHEVGHNLGAAHDTSNTTNSVYSYGHGYVYTPSDWHTVMSYPPNGNSTRINRFSNPDETYSSVATGTYAIEDNARAMDNRVSTVSNFDPPAPPPVVTISGTTLMDEGENETWNSTIVDGEAPYTYEWKRIVLGQGGTGTVVSTSTSYSGVQNESFDLILTVSDFFNESDTDRIFVTVEDGGGCQPGFPCKVVGENLPTEFGLSDNYPNPFNPSTQIKFELPEKAEVSIEVYNIMGQKVATLINNQLQAGFHNTTFKADNLSSGVYIARLQAIGNSGERFVQEIKMQLIK